jgi:hypothetical protein
MYASADGGFPQNGMMIIQPPFAGGNFQGFPQQINNMFPNQNIKLMDSRYNNASGDNNNNNNRNFSRF